MTKDKENKVPNSRREFLKAGLLFGCAATTGGVLFSKFAGADDKSRDKLKMLTPEGKVVEVNASDVHQSHSAICHTKSREGIPGKKFVMVVDLSSCRNARRCIESCQKMHDLPVQQEYLKVKQMQDSPEAAPYWFPQMCNHCDEPACTKVCPVGATYKRSDGIVSIDNERCIGCRFCIAACPYGARTFNWGEPTTADGSRDSHTARRKGTVDKCDFCPEMVKKGELPSCVTACPNGVFYFGCKNEDMVTNGAKTVRFSELIRDKAAYRHLEDFGTEPNVYYLPAVNRGFPFERGLDNFNEAEKRINEIDNI